MQQILRRLLKEQDYLSEQALADDLGISKRTVQRELEGTEKALSSYNLKLVRQKRAGILLEGSDTDKNELAEAFRIRTPWTSVIKIRGGAICSLSSYATERRKTALLQHLARRQ